MYIRSPRRVRARSQDKVPYHPPLRRRCFRGPPDKLSVLGVSKYKIPRGKRRFRCKAPVSSLTRLFPVRRKRYFALIFTYDVQHIAKLGIHGNVICDIDDKTQKKHNRRYRQHCNSYKAFSKPSDHRLTLSAVFGDPPKVGGSLFFKHISESAACVYRHVGADRTKLLPEIRYMHPHHIDLRVAVPAPDLLHYAVGGENHTG